MSDDSKDEARRIILARRRRFVAVALTSAGVATSACDKNPMVCLSVEPSRGGAAPMPCLSAPPDRMPDDAGTAAEDAGSDAGAEADAGTEAEADGGSDAGADGGEPRPKVCLTVAPPKKKPAPRPCLTPLKPDLLKTPTKG